MTDDSTTIVVRTVDDCYRSTVRRIAHETGTKARVYTSFGQQVASFTGTDEYSAKAAGNMLLKVMQS
jgi:hypothetical protein